METLPRPTLREDRTGPQFWIDEAIWGHRLHDEQTPWLTVLEFLGVMQAEVAKGCTFVEDVPNTLSYRPQQQLRLRNLLFNNPHIVTVMTELSQDDERWSAWLSRMKETAGGLSNPDFGYLQRHFESFHDFAALVSFLQSSAIEGGSNKRWSSKFVFPFGSNSLYEDLKVSQSSMTNDRRFFGRTGEILYLMLCRSRDAAKLGSLTSRRLLGGDGAYDKLVGILQGDDKGTLPERGGSYLPLKSHQSFDRLAEDWLSLLQTRMPVYDTIPYLVTMTGINLVLYQLQRAREILGRPGMARMVWEIVGPKRTKVRELSERSYKENDALSVEAIEFYVRSITKTPEWQTALASEDPKYASAELLRKKFDWPDEEDMAEIKGDPPQLVELLVQKARVRHRQHVARFHGAWSRITGFSSRRSSRSTRYAPTDRLLKALVVCQIQKRMEFKEFLECLYSRYGIVIADQQASELTSDGMADHEDFSDNAKRLEERLASLGLLERFSDSCAYVVNPFEKTFS